MVEEPGYALRFVREENSTLQSSIEISASPEDELRVRDLVEKHQELIPANSKISIHVEERIIPHTGLGSGTQLTLATLTGLLAFTHKDPTIAELHRLSKRAKRSCIGLYGFLEGGCYIDQGKSPISDKRYPPVRIDFPAEWSIVLIMPEEETGLSGKDEQQAFSEWPRFRDDQLDLLAELTEEIIPKAVMNQNFEVFSNSITKYGQIIGESFSQFQGGTFQSHLGNAIEQTLLQLQIVGYAQSSWGPTICAFTEDSTSAEELVAKLQSAAWGQKCRFIITKGANSGASMSTIV